MGGEMTYSWLEIIISVLGIVGTFTGAWAGWFFGRRLYKVQVESGQLDNTEKNLEIYQSMLDDLEKRRQRRETELEGKIKLLKGQVHSLRQEVKKCREEHRNKQS